MPPPTPPPPPSPPLRYVLASFRPDTGASVCLKVPTIPDLDQRVDRQLGGQAASASSEEPLRLPVGKLLLAFVASEALPPPKGGEWHRVPRGVREFAWLS